MTLRTAILAACSLAAGSAHGQVDSQPITIGETATIESAVLDETRRVYVATPESYDQNQERYAVVYVLDADLQFRHAVASAEFLGGFANQMIPPLLVVGIGNTDRMRDMTPPSDVPENPFLVQGGADRFLEFIIAELKPWVDERYRTSGYSVLVGHSLSGLFAVHAMLSRPDAFDGYLVIDPSLNWNSQSSVEQARAFFDQGPDLESSLYLAASSVDAPEFAGTQRFVEMLRTDPPRGLRWNLVPFTGETHDSLALPATFQGLRWLFAAWDVERQAEGLFSDAPADEIYRELDEVYRRSGEQFGLVRQTPYLVFESLLGYLADNDRVGEAAALTLRHANRYPLPLVPNVIAGMAQLLVDGGDRDAAIAYLYAVLEIYPGNATAREALMGLGVDPPAQ